MSLRSSSVRKNQIISEEKFTAKGEQYKESYQIGRMLGKGGFATVFEATSTSDDKKYAVKIIPIQTSKPDSMDKVTFIICRSKRRSRLFLD
jgi:serine/threonine protein kinase